MLELVMLDQTVGGMRRRGARGVAVWRPTRAVDGPLLLTVIPVSWTVNIDLKY